MDVPSYITIGGWFIQVIFDKYLSSRLLAWATNSGIGDDLEKLRIAMLRIQSLLSCTEKTSSNGFVRWMKELRNVVYDAEDLLDELEYRRLRQQLEGETSSPVSAFLASNLEAARDAANRAGGFLSSNLFNSSEGDNAMKTKHGNSRPLNTPELTWDRATKASIQTITERLNQASSGVSETLTLFKLEHCNGLTQRTEKGTTSSVSSTKVFGRQNNAKNLVELLLRLDDVQVSILPIVGMGGIGKTTLAQLVYSNPKIVEHFELRMWVHVSSSFSDMEFTREILECASDDKHEFDGVKNFDRLQSAIKEKLMRKRYLLVLDDVWNQENSSKLSVMERWAKLLAPLKAGKNGSKILMTTRSRVVSEMLTARNSINLKGLSDQDCWSLIKEITFSGANPVEELKLEEIGQKIAQRAKGSPLAAKAAAIILKNKQNAEEWKMMLEGKNLYSDIIPIMKPSYDNLPAHLQRCFAYCSIFPKCWKFSDDLIHLWMAQGYIQPKSKDARMQEIGQDYMDELVCRSFFEVEKKEFVTHYVIPDLLHEMACAICKDECIRVEDNEPTNIPPSIRHLFIKSEQFAAVTDVYQFHNLRTLICCSEIQSNVRNVLEDVLKNLKSIRVLDLSNCKMDDLPEAICHCIHLRYLNLSATSIRQLPESLCRLYHLQVLNLLGCSLLSLPSCMNRLVNLRHLAAAHQLVSDIAEIGRLICLQRLEVFRVRYEIGYKIEELKDLNELQKSLHIRNLENVQGKNEASEAMLHMKGHLSGLQLHWLPSQRNHMVDAEVLEGLRPHQNLKRLEIIGCRGNMYPTWLETEWLTNLEIIYLSGNENWGCLPPLAQLPSLKVLWIQGLHSVKRIGTELFGTDEKALKWLEELVLDDMPQLECLEGRQMFPHLKSVVIKDCNKLKTLPPLPSSLTELTVLNQGFWLPYYDDMRMGKSPSVVSSLCIYNCSLLIAEFSVLLLQETLSSLRTLCIGDLSLLTGLIIRKNLARLQNLDIQNCLEITLLTIEQEKAFENLTALKSLCFSGCANLQYLPELRGLHSLEKLIILNCPLIQSLPKKGLPSLLKVLEIDSCHPLLKEGFRNNCADYWLSIKHVPRVEIDGEMIQENASGN
ncbi:putative disease resistance protein RGA3 [Zingiber officinale]|uniref:Uncharacterized protein n=1 Tax=Zingiber officinale TaxID=94328 RepID=A0A8J5FHZ5_ZINOF|nr:putative disease resistance protein RGA3 [Zingiber officinale]KAG6486053.1 hypothetical protein ZIOFF_054623 [Zingiber officinale]